MGNDDDICSMTTEDTSPGIDKTALAIPRERRKISFNIFDTRIVNEGLAKYVAYYIIITETNKVDKDETIIERRYSDFEKLHSDLKDQLPELIPKITLPRKKISFNFRKGVIEERASVFASYLNHIFQQNHVKDTVAFKSFFYDRHLRSAFSFLSASVYEESCREFTLAYNLQKKLEDDVSEIIPTLCGLVEVHKNLQNYEKVDHYGLECLTMLDKNLSNPFLLPLIRLLKELRQNLRLDGESLQLKYRKYKELLGIDDNQPIQTLREVISKRF